MMSSMKRHEEKLFVPSHQKVNGFYPIGTYGSGPLMSIEERKRVTEVALDEVNGCVPVIMHAGSITTAQTVEPARHAKQSGADVVGAIPPHYYRYPEEDLLESIQIPVFAYNNPELSNNPISLNMITKLAEEGLAGLKDRSFDLIQFYNFLNEIEQSDFMHIAGTGAISAASVHAGACSIISGLANVWSELMAELWQALESNNGRAAGELQLRVLKAHSIQKSAPTLVTCSEVLEMQAG